MATARLSMSALFGTVTTAAESVTNILGAVNGGVGMLASYVTVAADHQRMRQLADGKDFVEHLIREKAQQRTTADIQVNTFMAKSPDHQKFYNEAYAEFDTLLRPNKDGVV